MLAYPELAFIGVLELLVVNYRMAFKDFYTGTPGMLMMTLAGWLAVYTDRRLSA